MGETRTVSWDIEICSGQIDGEPVWLPFLHDVNWGVASSIAIGRPDRFRVIKVETKQTTTVTRTVEVLP